MRQCMLRLQLVQWQMFRRREGGGSLALFYSWCQVVPSVREALTSILEMLNDNPGTYLIAKLDGLCYVFLFWFLWLSSMFLIPDNREILYRNMLACTQLNELGDIWPGSNLDFPVCYGYCVGFMLKLKTICMAKGTPPRRKKRFLSGIVRRGGEDLARICWPFFHHVTVPYALTSISCYVKLFGNF